MIKILSMTFFIGEMILKRDDEMLVKEFDISIQTT